MSSSLKPRVLHFEGRRLCALKKVRQLHGPRQLPTEPVSRRVHLSAIGHPILGDSVYGRTSPLIVRQFLHAWKLAFAMPLGERQVEFESPLPMDLREALEKVRDS